MKGRPPIESPPEVGIPFRFQKSRDLDRGKEAIPNVPESWTLPRILKRDRRDSDRYDGNMHPLPCLLLSTPIRDDSSSGWYTEPPFEDRGLESEMGCDVPPRGPNLPVVHQDRETARSKPDGG